MVEALIDQWDGWTEHQRALDIEYLFGWNPAFWNAKAWTIAVGEGLFTHVERAEHVEVRKGFSSFPSGCSRLRVTIPSLSTIVSGLVLAELESFDAFA